MRRDGEQQGPYLPSILSLAQPEPRLSDAAAVSAPHSHNHICARHNTPTPRPATATSSHCGTIRVPTTGLGCGPDPRRWLFALSGVICFDADASAPPEIDNNNTSMGRSGAPNTVEVNTTCRDRHPHCILNDSRVLLGTDGRRTLRLKHECEQCWGDYSAKCSKSKLPFSKCHSITISIAHYYYTFIGLNKCSQI